jgi:hypothetical protein
MSVENAVYGFRANVHIFYSGHKAMDEEGEFAK